MVINFEWKSNIHYVVLGIKDVLLPIFILFTKSAMPSGVCSSQTWTPLDCSGASWKIKDINVEVEKDIKNCKIFGNEQITPKEGKVERKYYTRTNKRQMKKW